jgi:hypothetical protein
MARAQLRAISIRTISLCQPIEGALLFTARSKRWAPLYCHSVPCTTNRTTQQEHQIKSNTPPSRYLKFIGYSIRSLYKTHAQSLSTALCLRFPPTQALTISQPQSLGNYPYTSKIFSTRQQRPGLRPHTPLVAHLTPAQPHTPPKRTENLATRSTRRRANITITNHDLQRCVAVIATPGSGSSP